MTDKPTLDTNILIYAFGKQEDARKQIAFDSRFALSNHCSVLYSEDLQNNQIIKGRLQIINPFANLQ